MFNDKCSMINVYDALFAYCESENFAGYDPFDGLNSRIFQASPLKYFSLARLAWLQAVKRSAKNLRPVLKVEKGINPKGLALFALAELSRFRANFHAQHAANAKALLKKLLALKIQIPNPKSRSLWLQLRLAVARFFCARRDADDRPDGVCGAGAARSFRAFRRRRLSRDGARDL